MTVTLTVYVVTVVTIVTVSHLYVVTVCGRGNPPLAPPCTEEAAVMAAYLGSTVQYRDITVTVPGYYCTVPG